MRVVGAARVLAAVVPYAAGWLSARCRSCGWINVFEPCALDNVGSAAIQ